MPRQHDPEELEHVFRAHPLRGAWRLWSILMLIVGQAGRLLHIEFRRAHWTPARFEHAQHRAALHFRDALVTLGPTFIKIGQLLSTRPDILPSGYLEVLETLQDRVPPFDTDLALALIRSELGQEVNACFAEFDVRPVSAASIGQVYRARLADGTAVAVKVQRPGLLALIQLDLAMLRRLARFLAGKDLRRFHLPLSPDMPYVAIVDRFAQSLYDQMDFLQEARHMERFRANFADFPGVTAPRPYPGWSSERVLTMDFIEGVRFDDLETIASWGIDYLTVANRGVRAFIKQLLEDGFFHADTHPGNIFVRPDGEVVYLDFGMVDTIPEDLQVHLVDCFLHLVYREFDAFVTDLVRLGFLHEEVDRSRVIPLVEEIYEAQIGEGQRPYTTAEILGRLRPIMHDHPFYLPDRFAFLMRTVSTMEGVVLRHNPGYQFLAVGLPYAGKLMLDPRKRHLRDRLVGDLTREGRLELDRLLDLYVAATREPSFRAGELASPALDYVLSDEGRDFREALVTSLLDPAPWAATAPLRTVLARLVDDPSLEPVLLMNRILSFMSGGPGLDLCQRVIPSLDRIPVDSPALGSVLAWGGRWLESAGRDDLVEVVVTGSRLLETLPGPLAEQALERLLLWVETGGLEDWEDLTLRLWVRLGTSRRALFERLARVADAVPLPVERLVSGVLRPVLGSSLWQDRLLEALASGEADPLLHAGWRLALRDRTTWIPALSLLTALGPAGGVRLLAVLRDRLTYLTLQRFLPWLAGASSTPGLS